MKKKSIRLQYNAPVILSFALLSLAVLGLSVLTGGKSNTLFFCVYRAPLRDPLTYPRFFLHVLGHSDLSHYMSNMLLLLVVGPPMEEKYGSQRMLIFIAITAFVTGLSQFLFFPGSALLGASGIVFMLIMLSSLSGAGEGAIPITLLCVAVLYLGRELFDGLGKSDQISQLTHIIGGVCGIVFGFLSPTSRKRKK